MKTTRMVWFICTASTTTTTTTGEECDDGNGECADGCDPNCRVSGCGSAYVCPAAGEACDDVNTASGDGCAGDCSACKAAPDAEGDGWSDLCDNCPNDANSDQENYHCLDPFFFLGAGACDSPPLRRQGCCDLVYSAGDQHFAYGKRSGREVCSPEHAAFQR